MRVIGCRPSDTTVAAVRGEVAVRAVVFDVGGVFLLPSPEVLRPALAAVGAVVEADELFHRAHFVGTSTLDATSRRHPRASRR